jgi:hypothetical protein
VPVETCPELPERDRNTGGGPGETARAVLLLFTHPTEGLMSDQKDGWRPIESAPKDGPVLIAEGNGAMCVAVWDRGDDEWMAWGAGDGTLHCIVYPTHWRPLPPPPGDDT